MPKNFNIADCEIGDGQPTFIIAEMSANHEQNLDTAIRIVEAAAEAGADAVKLQTYTPDTMTINCNKKWFQVGGADNPEAWKGQTFYDLYKKAYTPWEWHPKINDAAKKNGILCFSTPFDHTAVDFLEEQQVPCYKIASYEANYIPLLKKVAQTGKPVIMSVGFADLDEITYSVGILRENGCEDLALLHCTTSYSAKAAPNFTNLRTVDDIRERFDVIAGFSDNMGGIEIPALAAASGSAILEKHIVLEHDSDALDGRFSLDPIEFKQMVEKIRWQEKVMGKVNYGCQTDAEIHNRSFRRSLFAGKDIKKGETFTNDNVSDVRPAVGLETRYLDDLIGKAATQDIEFGTPLTWELVQR